MWRALSGGRRLLRPLSAAVRGTLRRGPPPWVAGAPHGVCAETRGAGGGGAGVLGVAAAERRQAAGRAQRRAAEPSRSEPGRRGGAAGVNLWVLPVRDTWAVALLASRLVLRPGSVMIVEVNGSRGVLSRRAGERGCRAGLPSAPGAAQAPQNGERRRLRRWVTRCQSLRRRRGAGLAGPRVAVRQHIQKATDRPLALPGAPALWSGALRETWPVGKELTARDRWDLILRGDPGIAQSRGVALGSTGTAGLGVRTCAERCRPRSPAGTGRVGGSAAPARV